MDKGNLIVLVLVAVLVGSRGAPVGCPLPAAQQSQILSDSVLFEAQLNQGLTNAQKLIYNYPFRSRMNAQPNIAIGTPPIIQD